MKSVNQKKSVSIGVSERLTYYAKQLGISLEAIEQVANLSQGYIMSISRSIGVDELNKILSRLPELSKDWLLHARGDMLRPHTKLGNNHERTERNDNISSPSVSGNSLAEKLRIERKEIDEIVELIKKEDALISRHLAKESKLIDQFYELTNAMLRNGGK